METGTMGTFYDVMRRLNLPWFMNLVRLPECQVTAPLYLTAERQTVRGIFGNTAVDFIGAFEPRIGAFEVCSLYSPMFEFDNQAATVATAQEILNQLRRPTPAQAPDGLAAPNRRGFLFGRVAASPGAAT
jgi:[NiFe] hydrogenase assembly HybE family chaperone